MAHLTAAARALAAISDRAELLSAITTTVAGLRQGALCTLRLAEAGELRLAACAGPAAAPSTVGALDEELAAQVSAGGEPVLVADARIDARVRRPALWHEWAYAGYYGLPLPGVDGTLGVVALILPAETLALGADERRMVEMYAIQATLALRQQAAVRVVEDQRRALEIARAELLDAAKLAALGHLVSDVVHQVSNLLGSATLRMESLRDGPRDAETEVQLHILDAHCREITSLIGQLRRFARPGNAFELGLDLDALVDELIELRRLRMRSRSIELRRVRPAAPLPDLRGDRGQLERAVLALLLDAEDAVGAAGGGTITLATGPGADPRASVRVTVQDDGPSIPEERLASMFDALAPRGAGRGPSINLAAAHATVTAHGGSLTVANRAGGGVVFQLELPAGQRLDGPAGA